MASNGTARRNTSAPAAARADSVELSDPFAQFGVSAEQERTAPAPSWWKASKPGEWAAGRFVRVVQGEYKGDPTTSLVFEPSLYGNTEQPGADIYPALGVNYNGSLERRINKTSDVGKWFGIQYTGDVATTGGNMRSYRVVELTEQQAADMFDKYGHGEQYR